MILRKRKTAPTALPQAKVKGKRCVKRPSCNLVRPGCIQNRLFDVQVKTVYQPGVGAYNAIITEFLVHPKVDSCSVLQKTTVSLVSKEDKNYYGRVIGKPLVIGCRDDHLILQFISNDNAFFRFAYVNTRKCTCQTISDEVLYYAKHFYLQGAVECYITPDLSCAYFRVQQPLRPFSKGCQLLKVQLPNPDEECAATGDQLQMKVEHNFSDHRFQSFLFKESKPDHLIVVTVNRYCSKCLIEEYQLTDFSILKSTRLSIHDAIYQQSPDTSCTSTQSLDGINTRNLVLLQCSVVLSKAKSDIIVCTYNIITEANIKLFKVGIFSSETFYLKRNYMFLPDDYFCQQGSRFPAIFIPETNITDQSVAVWYHEREKIPVKLSVETGMPRTLDLKIICRQMILQNCSTLHVCMLPLPSRIMDFLLYK